ncbi:hypothetical protein [uncultured Treponema sp.]|uniref:hypothetical protein n=1 Tax=uncultured Treponema sp. TaxID=162155 RepID=UPI0025E7ED97|nr:hypothetical protein [uncultured Treponema sp.]
MTISSTLWFLAIWGICFFLNPLPKNFSKIEIKSWCICILILIIPFLFAFFLKLFTKFFSLEEIRNIQSCTLADNEFLPIYLGYFFVALGINSWRVLIFVYCLILIFTFVSNSQYFNPAYLILGYHTYHAETEQGTQLILLIKGKLIRNKDEIINLSFYRLNDTTYISRK